MARPASGGEVSGPRPAKGAVPPRVPLHRLTRRPRTRPVGRSSQPRAFDVWPASPGDTLRLPGCHLVSLKRSPKAAPEGFPGLRLRAQCLPHTWPGESGPWGGLAGPNLLSFKQQHNFQRATWRLQLEAGLSLPETGDWKPGHPPATWWNPWRGVGRSGHCPRQPRPRARPPPGFYMVP